MMYRQLRWLLIPAVAVFSLVLSSANFALADPFSPSVADIRGLGDVTDGFHSGEQLSTIDAIHEGPGGIHLDVTWRVGQQDDPFAPDFGKTYARVSLALYTNGEDEGLGRLLNPPYDGIKWCIMTDQDSFVQPFIQTAPNWTYYEPGPGGYGIPGDMTSQMVTLDFNDARNFNSLLPANIVHPDENGEIRANSMGLQFGGPGGLVVGQPVTGHIWIADWGVPEPSSALLLVLGVVGLVGRARRRKF